MSRWIIAWTIRVIAAVGLVVAVAREVSTVLVSAAKLVFTSVVLCAWPFSDRAWLLRAAIIVRGSRVCGEVHVNQFVSSVPHYVPIGHLKLSEVGRSRFGCSLCVKTVPILLKLEFLSQSIALLQSLHSPGLPLQPPPNKSEKHEPWKQ